MNTSVEEKAVSSQDNHTRTLPRGDGEIAYEVHGAGPLVMCVPGMGELRTSYRYNVRPLVEAGFRVATMDLRGHGDSDATFEAYDDVAAGSDLLALVEELGAGPALVVGSSMGAGAAVWAAAERPDLVAGVALLGPFVRQVPINPVMAWAFRVAMSGPWATTVWHSYLPSLYPGRKPADFAEHRAAIRASMRRPGHAKAFTATTRTSHAPAEARLPAVQAPALVVMGTADPDFKDPAAEAAWIVEHLRDAEQLLVEGAGHYPQAEEPDTVNPALVAFAKRVLGA
ncbi:MAG TPA: alpha/beta hydrolase [Nocardioides sp.]|nr:alpha/beta hydrolase [Nocardioides sp.]